WFFGYIPVRNASGPDGCTTAVCGFAIAHQVGVRPLGPPAWHRPEVCVPSANMGNEPQRRQDATRDHDEARSDLAAPVPADDDDAERPTGDAPMTDPATGLSEAEAAARLLAYGPNVLAAGRRRTLAIQFLSRFKNPLVLILLAASALEAVTG